MTTSDGILRAFHGTTSRRAEVILRDGLSAGSYLCESLDLARYYANEAVEAAAETELDAGVETTIEVDVPRALLRYDANAMDEPVMTGDVRRDMAWHQAAGDHPDWVVGGYICVPPEAWEVSWAGVGSVRTESLIAPAALRRLRDW